MSRAHAGRAPRDGGAPGYGGSTLTTRARAAVSVVAGLVLVLTACGDGRATGDPRGASSPRADGPEAVAAPPRIEALPTGDAVPPMMATLTTAELVRPLELRVRPFRVGPGSGPAGGPVTATGRITLTEARFDRTSGAIAAYNGWFATFGFPAAAERTPLPLGEAAERFDLAWPPLHALIVREGRRFLLLEADARIPDAARAAALERLAAEALAARDDDDGDDDGVRNEGEDGTAP